MRDGREDEHPIWVAWSCSRLDALKVPQGSRHIKFRVEDEEELEGVAEEEDGDDGDQEVGEVLLPPII